MKTERRAIMDNCQLPKGYKNTEVGVIPEDWEVKSISEIVDVDTDNLTTSTNPDYVFKYISLEDVDFGILRNYSEQIFKFAPSRARRKVKKGDILISTVRPNLKSHLLITEEVQDWICSTGFSVLRSKNQTDNVFLFNHFFASIINRQIENLITGSNYPAINSKEVKSLQIPLPPTKAEQTAIATALSDADALINSLSTLIAKKRNIKQGAMQKLLKPKEGWEVKKLGDFLDYEQPTEYLVTDTEYNDNNQIPVLTAGKTFILGYTNEEHGIFKNLPVIIFDDFTTAIKYVDFPFKAKSSAMKMLLPKNEKVNLRFIFEIMLQIKYQVADHKRHWIGEYSKIEIKVLSTPEEQNEIATILSDMDAEIQALETKLEKYRKIKLGMMQNLLTGKIRLV
ncbi:MAG: restriction endonuclease subunit S [Bacteroidales bacterium]|nr:restriction endonuclease subunit S [Bacteroidales bacterium]